MASKSLHPQNARVGDGGHAVPAGLTYRFPPVYVARGGEVKHETPLCPDLRGEPYHMACREEALYTCGERRCETCQMYRYQTDESGWTDPRFQRGESDGE